MRPLLVPNRRKRALGYGKGVFIEGGRAERDGVGRKESDGMKDSLSSTKCSSLRTGTAGA